MFVATFVKRGDDGGDVATRSMLRRCVAVSKGKSWMGPIVHQVSGSFLVVTGLIVLPLPIPLGLIMLTIGMALLAPYVPAVQRMIRSARRRFPRFDKSLRLYRKKFPDIVRKAIDKTHPRAPAE